MDCGRRPHLPKICAQYDQPPSENADFDRFRLIVPQAWELATVAINASRNSTTRFPSSRRWTVWYDIYSPPCALLLSPQKGGSKREFLHLALPFISSLQPAGNRRHFKLNMWVDWLNIASPSLRMTKPPETGVATSRDPF